MKSGILLIASIPLAIATAIWIAPLGAQTGSLDAFCPDSGPAPRCGAAVGLYLGGNPSDTDIIATINAIADGTRSRQLTAASCDDLHTAFEAMAGAVEDAGNATLIRTLADALCPGGGGGGIAGGAATASLAVGVDAGAPPSFQSSGQSSGSSGQSSGQSSGSSGQSSGSSGQSSGSSGQSSGSSGQSSGTI